MKKWVIIGLAAVAGGFYYWQANRICCPVINYSDISGTQCRIGPGNKPAIVGFWIADCIYGGHAMYLLSEIRKKYPENKLDVVGFYLNNISQEDLARVTDERGYAFTIAAAQPPIELIAELVETFGFKFPGRHLYVIDKKGHVEKIDVEDFREKNNLALARIEKVLKSVVK